jgi:hypothetical protein
MPLRASDIPLIAAAAVVLAAALVAIALFWRRRNTPAEKERRRRASVNRIGRMTDGMIVDFETLPASGKRPEAALFHFTYSVGGVDYSTAQDVFTLIDRIGLPPERYIGPVHVKYEPGNGSNSIIVCEDWSGLRLSKASPGLKVVAAVD